MPFQRKRLWDHEKVARMRELAEQGLTTREVAIELGCTKNVVVGQGRRAIPPVKWTYLPRQFYVRPGNSGKGIKNPKKGIRRKKLKLEDIPAPEAKMIKFTELNGHDCHWPYGSGPYLFCAASQDAGSCYCLYHKVMAIRDFVREPRKKKAA